MPLGSFPMKLGWKSTSGQRKTFATNSDDIAIWQLIRLLLVGTLCSGLHLSVEVQGDVAEFFLDIAHNLTLGCRGERVTALCENFHEVLCEVTASEIKTQNGVRQRIAFVDGHSVGDAITRIHNNTSGATRSVEREHRLDSYVHGRCVEGFERDLRHTLTV